MSTAHFFLCFLVTAAAWNIVVGQYFAIDFKNNAFIKDGLPFRYISGSIHYARIPYYYWADRLQKMNAAGLDTIQVYVPWNVHEPTEGNYDFECQNDLTTFLRLAQRIGLLVILRPGPYICAEWEYGGFPAWIKNVNSSMILRSMDAGYIRRVDRWMSVLLPKVEPLLYANGGPVIMVQVENEYGSYRGVVCDHDYMRHLTETFNYHLGHNVLLFTTDGCSVDYLECGATPGAYATVDFGPGNATAGLEPMRTWNPNGPLVNSEYYTGWLDFWGGQHATTASDYVIKTLKDMLDMGASVNMYMFEGGTNFGYMNGADPPFKINPTSYDYDAPLSEAGDTTEKFWAIRKLISQYKVVPEHVPPNSTKADYGLVNLHYVSTVENLLNYLGPSPPVKATYPLTMEQVKQNYGFLLYGTVLKNSYPTSVLNVSGIRDRGYVMLDGIPQGVVDRNGLTAMTLLGRKKQILSILVENQGRINYGGQINDNIKGIISNVTLNGDLLKDWFMFPLNFTRLFDDSAILEYRPKAESAPLPLQPSVYMGTFVLPQERPPADTFLNLCGWYKGQAFLNGFNLGRYWPSVGPQVTLYIPHGTLMPHPANNTLILVELEQAPCIRVEGHADAPRGIQCAVNMTSTPIVNGRCFSPGEMEWFPTRNVIGKGRRI